MILVGQVTASFAKDHQVALPFRSQAAKRDNFGTFLFGGFTGLIFRSIRGASAFTECPCRPQLASRRPYTLETAKLLAPRVHFN